MKYYLDRDGDLWVTKPDGTMICMGERIAILVRDLDGIPAEAVARNYGPMTELLPSAHHEAATA